MDKASSDEMIIILLIYCFMEGSLAIDCFECVSIAGQNPQCEDEFGPHNTTEHLLHRNCRVGYLNFRAFYCVKIKGQKADGQSVLIRTCSMDNWGTNCGNLLFEHAPDNKDLLYGCLASCDYDGCNSAVGLTHYNMFYTWLIPLTLLFVFNHST